MKKAKGLKTRFVEPYKKNENGVLKPNLPYLRYDKIQSGVYLIKSERTGNIVYVGVSETNLYRTIYRHFQQWTDISRTKQTRFTYKKEGYKVRVIFTTKSRALILEKYLILKINPKDNPRKYNDYLTETQTKTAIEIADNLPTYTGSDKDFPF